MSGHNPLKLASLDRLKAGLFNIYGLDNLDEWITKYTNMSGRPFSFKDHEFQIPILRDSARTSIIVKCAQVGLSELAYRWAVAACCSISDFTCIYTFASASDAELNNRSRVDPMINDSPYVKALVNPNMNNSSMKQFGRNSFLFFKGTKSETQALSIPANAVIHDEYDKSDITQASVYVSRLQHKPHKIRKIFSTPTVEKYGVSKEAETAQRYRHLATCNRCNHTFLPDYYEHIVVPGWDRPLVELNKQNLATTKWREAYLCCPKCGKDPQLHHSRMQFVCENQAESHAANAWYVSPFSAHSIITPSYLVETSTKFEKVSEFKNQSLGLTSEEQNESITLADIEAAQCHADLSSSEFHVMGADMGITCHVCIGRMSHDGTFLIVHRERIHYTKFEQRILELSQQYRVVLTVADSLPYTDLITRLSRSRANFWGAIFVNTKSPQAFTLQEEAANEAEGKMQLKLVKVNRTVALDELLSVIKSRKLAIQKSEENLEYQNQMLSLKRVQKFTRDGELVYTWEKTGAENDHFHFATLYLFVAVQLRGLVRVTGAVHAGVPLVTRFRPGH